MLNKNKDVLIQWILLIDAFNYSEEELKKEDIDELENKYILSLKTQEEENQI
ncbi:hypothetical protein [Staphylococcus equorum]|uniref:hypothetical protein n=1 Tax=Staphylococcus equorum TaxID=246432 RepID=UPI00159F1F0F|nr:hypothetical protein [Staphylococcus equorum]